MGTEIKAAAIAAALGAFAGGAPGEAPVGTEQRSNAGAHLVPGAGPAGAATMRAAVQRRYGPPAVLQVAEIERPLPGRGDVLVQVVAASVHPGDYFVMTGEPYVVRLVFGLRRPRHGIPGRDLAGVVAAVGKDVTDLQPGDEVFGWSTAGTLAEYACVPADNLAPVPANLSVVEAAAVPTSAMTALQALRDIATRATGPDGAGHRRVGRRGHLRRPDRQGVRRRGDRCLQHPQRRPRPVARRRPRHRLHDDRLHLNGSATTSSSTTWKPSPWRLSAER